MTPLLSALGIAILGLCGFIVWKLSVIQKQSGSGVNNEKLAAEKDELIRQCAELKTTLDRKTEEVGDLKAQIQTERSEKNEQQGKGKVMYAESLEMKSQIKRMHEECDALKKQIAKHEAQERQREKEFDQKLSRLEAAKVSLEEERQRVIREDEERLRKEAEERDRLWAEHELSVIAQLTDLCKQPQFAFTSFSNTNLPEGFDGSLKPDFMIDFLGQYVIFDAKVSKAKSLQDYITDQVKRTVGKVKKNDQICKTIFLVVPSSALQELKSHHHVVDGYSLFIIGPESLAPILSSLKRISLYEFAEQMDPQERENIVQLIAELDFHINLRNAADILLTKMGTEILDKAQKLDPALADEVALKKQPMNAKASLAAADIKKIVAKLTTQNEEIAQLVAPHARVRKKELKKAEAFIADTLL